MSRFVLLLTLATGCRCSESPTAGGSPPGVVAAGAVPHGVADGSALILDLSEAVMAQEDFDRLQLDGGWVYQPGPDELDLRFRVHAGKLVVDGPLGDYVGGLVGDVLVMRRVGAGEPPSEAWLNLAPTGDGGLAGWQTELGGEPSAPTTVVLRRR